MDIVKDWEPPFKTQKKEKAFSVNIGETFSEDLDKEFQVFKLLKFSGDKALLEYSDQYTVKGHEHPTNRQVWVSSDNFTKFSALWSKRGLTKMVKLELV